MTHPFLFGMEGTSADASVASKVSPPSVSFMKPEREKVRRLMETKREFSPFLQMPDALLEFVIAEKLHTFLVPETREIIEEESRAITGGFPSFSYGGRPDLFHPSTFSPFPIKGYWIPESCGQKFSLLKASESLPIIRENHGEKEILFLVHPKSENIFAPLITKYKASEIILPAMSLSSFRTLLVAFPTASGQFDYHMVKVSLDERINGTNRTLSRKESAGSVACTHVLEQKARDFMVMKDVFSFVPCAKLLSAKVKQTGAGMILRKVPDVLLNPRSQVRVLPLFSLLGQRNRPLLDLMIRNSGKTPTKFLEEHILRPYARLFLGLLFDRQISIEAHGQNLLLLVDAKTALPVPGHEFIYRDMGGVNTLLSLEELSKMPRGLNHPSIFYFDTHLMDGASSIEIHFVERLLFGLDKQFIKSSYESCDREFALWKRKMTTGGFLGNWTTACPEDDLHEEKLLAKEFYHYGYLTRKFAHILSQEMLNQDVFRRIAEKDPMLPKLNSEKFLSSEEGGIENKMPFRAYKIFIQDIYTYYLYAFRPDLHSFLGL